MFSLDHLHQGSFEVRDSIPDIQILPYFKHQGKYIYLQDIYHRYLIQVYDLENRISLHIEVLIPRPNFSENLKFPTRHQG